MRVLTRTLLLLAAASLSIWTVLDPGLRDSSGVPKAEICLFFAASVGLAVLAFSIATRWLKFGVWFAISLFGQALALQMIDAGNLIHYQHYKPLSRLISEGDTILILFLITQSVLVAVNVIKHHSELRAWLKRHFRMWQLIGVALTLFLSSAALSRDSAVYIKELFFAAFVQAVNLGSVLITAFAIPNAAILNVKTRIDKVIGPPGPDAAEPGGVDRFALLSAGWVLLLAAVLSFYSYARHPHIPDELVYLTQARYFATGNVSLPPPPAPEAFNIFLMELNGNRWYAVPPPGWPAVLSVGVIAGAPWLVNPILAALCILLTYVLVREFYNRRTARWVILLLCASPWFIFMAMNFMTHTLTLTCSLAAALGISWVRRTGNARWAWMAGAMVGMGSLIRPLEGLVVSVLLGLWSLGVGGRRLKTSSILAFALGTVLVGALVLPYNALLTGNPRVFPLIAYSDKHFGPNSNALGFGANRGIGWALQPFPGHSPLGALVNSNLNVFSLNTELLGWSCGSLLLVSLFLLSGKKQRADWLMLAVIVAIYGVHFFYWYSGGPDFGARYWYLMLIPLLVLTVRGIHLLQQKFASDSNYSEQGSRVALTVLSLCAIALVSYFPWRAIDKYYHYLNMRPDVRYLAQQYDFGRSLVLIRGNEHPDYASAAAYNPLDLRANAPVYAWDRDPQVRNEVLKAYSDRPVWLVDGPSLTQSGFKVVAGPIPPQQLLATSDQAHR